MFSGKVPSLLSLFVQRDDNLHNLALEEEKRIHCLKKTMKGRKNDRANLLPSIMTIASSFYSIYLVYTFEGNNINKAVGEPIA